MADDLEKVNPAGGRVTSLAAQTAQYRLRYTYPNQQYGGYTPGIVTGGPEDWFGPLNPQAPSAPPEVAGRRMDFASGFNLNLDPRANNSIKFFGFARPRGRI